MMQGKEEALTDMLELYYNRIGKIHDFDMYYKNIVGRQLDTLELTIIKDIVMKKYLELKSEGIDVDMMIS